MSVSSIYEQRVRERAQKIQNNRGTLWHNV